MSAHLDEDITIQEPPLQEFKKKSCFKKTCLNGCGCLVLVIIASLFLLRYLGSPNEKTLHSVPTELSSRVPLYDQNQAESILLDAGIEKQEKIQLFAFFPKLFVSPFVVYFPQTFLDERTFSSSSTKKDIFYNFMRAPLGKNQDTYTLTWTDLSAKPEFIAEYYNTELQKRSFHLQYNQKNQNIFQMAFTSSSTLVDVLVKDETKELPGTDKVIVTIVIETPLSK